MKCLFLLLLLLLAGGPRQFSHYECEEKDRGWWGREVYTNGSSSVIGHRWKTERACEAFLETIRAAGGGAG